MVCIDRRFDDGFAGLGESNIVSGVIAERPWRVNGSRCPPAFALPHGVVLSEGASRSARGAPALAQPSTTAYLLLDVAGVACALPRAEVREILPLPNLDRPPAAGNLLAGFLNLGGAPLPVVDLARLLGLRDAAAAEAIRDPYRHVVVATGGGTAYLVDRVVDLVTVEDAHRKPIADDQTLNGCVAAELTARERLVHVLAADRLLTQVERERLAVLTRAAQDRLAALGDARSA
ncbi:chemotaxis protein CheW [Methylobacterium iners]|nr:chemotaxis protein CheW [Methylobacterium iners]